VEDYVGSAISRSAIDVYNDHPIPHKVLLKAFLNRYYRLTDGLRIIVSRDSDKEVYFTHAHELAKEIVIEKGFFHQ
jgi:hypothetical protein